MSNVRIPTESELDELLTRGVHEVFGGEELRKKLLSGKKLHFKLGTDVTGSDLHFGHGVIHRKLRDFQDLGHEVTLIIGDYTTLVGDHSDKVDQRSETSTEQIGEFMQGFKNQFFKTVDESKTTIRYNSEWLSKLTFLQVIQMTKTVTLQKMFDRETFKLRYQEGKPIGFDEFLYPFMQGYDSVALNCDVELGGTDQTFNLLMGRHLMEQHKQDPQSIITMKLLLGADGRPMGKSLKNYIPINATPEDMYGKVMSVVDDVILNYFESITRVPMNRIAEIKSAIEAGENPMQFKKELAFEIVTFFHSKEAAEKAAESWSTAFQKGGIPDDIETFVVNSGKELAEVLIEGGVVSSKTDWRRLVEEGAVKVVGDEESTISDPKATMDTSCILKIGKKRFAKIDIVK
ncbi:MAG TPA: tyrosine--tRNA ligase [Candidatus Paceibacterota bacterium]